jgi:hypothetical protein
MVSSARMFSMGEMNSLDVIALKRHMFAPRVPSFDVRKFLLGLRKVFSAGRVTPFTVNEPQR